jgi:Putative capsular polysaccharide synthesis protein
MSELLTSLNLLSKIAVQPIYLPLKLYSAKHPPVLVYQMGKVGSSSVYFSLKELGIKPVFHPHFLLPFLVRDDREVFDESIKSSLKMKFKKIVARRNGYFIYKNIIAAKRKVKVISLTREPISRNISAFFQSFERETGKRYEDANFTPQELTDIFIKFYPHHIPLQWFDENIKKCLGIDIYEYAFPKEQGFLSIHKDNIDLLVIKSEIADNVKEQAIADFLGLKEFKLARMNVGENKSYRDMYKAFKQALKLPSSYVEEMCNSKYFNHFYTEEEIKKVFAQWNSVNS